MKRQVDRQQDRFCHVAPVNLSHITPQLLINCAKSNFVPVTCFTPTTSWKPVFLSLLITFIRSLALVASLLSVH